ncbi:uncharacterized protein [Amphiura filiformis]|uniref:uncharacterized protein n=1 Tax=Amphiura filiformis TaxID=82378 RepID=UPI003B21A8F0
MSHCDSSDSRQIIMEVLARSRFWYIAICLIAFGSCQIAGGVSTSIEVDPTGTNVIEGTNIFLRCTASNFNSNHVLSWSKNGERITRNDIILDDELKEQVEAVESNSYFHFDSTAITTSAESFINFASITKHDTGTYECDIYEAGTGDVDILVTISDAVDINVLYDPSPEYPECTPDTEVFINIGQPLVLKCLSEEGNPKVNLTWKRDFVNDNYQDTESVSAHGAGFVSSEFVIPRISLSEQNAVFSCRIVVGSDPLMPRRCSVRTHVILPEPLITISPQIAMVFIDESIQFTCSSYLPMNNLFWSTEPKDIEDYDIQLSSNKQVLTINDITAHDNESSISCTFQFKDDWIQVTAVLYVTEKIIEMTNGTTPAPDDSSMDSSGSLSVGSALGWMLAFIVATIIAIVGLVVCYLKLRSKFKSSVTNRTKTPYVINSINVDNINPVQGDGYDTMGTGNYAPYHRQQRPLSTLENPEYMRQEDYVGVPSRPIQIRTMSHVSQATTVEPDYMHVEA